jgi:hypothetical protein
MMSVVVAIFTAPINLFIDYLFVDILSAPSVDETKRQREQDTKPSQLSRIVKKAGESVRRASAVTADAVKVAKRKFRMGSSHKPHEAMQIPESTLEAHELARESSVRIIEERRDILEKEKSFRKDNRSQVLVQRHHNNKKRATKYKMSEEQLKRAKDDTGEAAELNELFCEFVVDLNEQRRALKPSVRERYDSQWG